jgi:HAE1 family hydrophobic/amphiphilic exporter-1
MIEGIKAGSFRKKGEEIEIVVRIDEESRRNINILRSSFIKIPNGKLIPIENFGEFKEEKGPVRIERENRERVLKITGNFYGRSLNEVIEDIKKVISEMNLPEYIRIEIGGSISQQKESFSFLFFSLIIGIILVYLVMVAQFSSFLHPFVIMFSVPFAFTGVSFAHLIAGIPFSLTSFIGLVMLIGIVVNNAIVLVDYINILRKRKYKLLDAVKEAGKRRLRPIIITTATTLFGLLPLALSRAEGSEAWRPLGISVIGGLFLSAFISLIIVPIVYVFIEKIKGEKNENASNNM